MFSSNHKTYRFLSRTTFILTILLLAQGKTALATTLVAQSFDDLVAKSEQIFIGVVDKVESKMTPNKKAIYTYVTFTNIEAIEGIGPLGDPYVMRFSGGQVGDYNSLYLGMPQFKVGEKVLLFTHLNEHAMCPLVGWTQGCFHVVEDGAQDALVDYSSNPIVGVDFAGNLQRADNPAAGGGGGSGSMGVDADGGDPGQPVFNVYNSRPSLTVSDFVEEIYATRDWTGFQPEATADPANNKWIRVPGDASEAQQLLRNLSPPEPAANSDNSWIPRAATVEEQAEDEPQSSSGNSEEGGESK